MTTKPIALCSAMALPDAGSDGVPEWINLLPAGEIATQDGRGPYSVASMEYLAAAITEAGAKLPVDECHSTDLAAPQGAPAPARGWIVEVEARDGALWGRVEWTGQGRALMEDRSYNGISPVIVHTKDNKVVGVLRASLTNTPNLKGLTALHSQESQKEGTGMDWKAKLIELLGLDETADDAAIETALKAKMETKAPETDTSTHGQQDITQHPAFIALQGELTETVQALNAQSDATKRDKATSFVDGAIADGRIGVKAARDQYIEIHMADPERAKTLIEAMPILKGGTALHSEIPATSDESGLDAGDRHVMQLMGIDEDAYKASQNGSAAKKEAL
ncbi:MAG: phage protease [Alteraurantiacibacter sp.]